MNLLVVLVIVLYPALFYFTWLFRKVSYSDTTILDKIDINGAPEEIAEQLKIISRNRLVNLNIILFLGETRRKPNQSEIVKHLTDSGINLTPTRIREIIGDLEKMHLIISVKGIHEREYSLTKKGDWCFAAAQYYFPKRNGLFVLRNQIVQKKFPPFPESDE